MKIEFSYTAEQELRALYDYIALDDPTAALSMIRNIRQHTDHLAEMPNRGRIGAIEGTREIVVNKHYIIVYMVGDALISILRIRHSAQHWPAS